ncbi:MAG: hypothetical protein AVDCRST_MAG30-3308 [uncultured Solirubrobacteraceae bacterium]|uniref:ABC1 atypical kinase-like domain-containing protein n=1 Tax=uncultured Solirubrobacteraceae bacterium TaxID=1162706 RepID=A0A6J4TJN0_9ACTN|nr:MAG: hypothetical protein AVDCRST_MAG30-3308 [uncultured Solirubrobacteraceae bacterium]
MPDRAQTDAARRAFAVLQSMRGVSGKLAQVADFVDPAWAPEGEERDRLEAQLAEIRSGAPEPLPAKRIERVLRDAWGGKISDHLAELEPEPAAMASAGQVHRGETGDGRVVAVKVIHPGLEEALRADLGNLSLLAHLAATAVQGLDPRAFAAELRDRALEEMDLEHEAQSQRAFWRAYRGHPFVCVPAPVTGLCHTGVLVSDWVEGTSFDEVLALGQGERDRYGEILARFHGGSMHHLSSFHADPHPGNHLLLDDGRVAFVDYGSVGRADPAWLAGLYDAAAAVETGDADRLTRDLAGLGYLAAAERVDGRFLLDHVRATGGWLLTGGRVTIDEALADELGAHQRGAARELADVAPHGRLPARDLLAGRLAGGLGAVLGRLRATAPWAAIGREYREGAEPATDLGAEEAAFWAERGHSRGPAVHELRRAA